MEDYKHGVETDRDASVEESTVSALVNVQVAIGTAPVNLLDDPMSAVNKPILVSDSAEVKKKLGVCADYKYTLMQTKFASFNTFGVAPVVMINVLDPSNSRHIIAVAGKKYSIENGVATISDKGILLSTIVVSEGETEAEQDKDYVATFSSDGDVIITVKANGTLTELKEITVAYTKLNPEGVTSDDIIGGEDVLGKCTGIELVEEVYPRLNVVPGIITAPQYSEDPEVAAALESKAKLSGDIANAMAVVDIETKTTRKKEQVADAKKKLGVSSRWVTACWPKVVSAGEIMSMSSFVAALLQSLCVANSNIPQSPDNKDFGIEGLALEDGTEVFLRKKYADNYIVANGVVTGLYYGGWKCWGSNTTAYPIKKDIPNERFIKCVMVGNYIENRFKIEYLSSIGTDANYKLVDSVVNNFNHELNSLVPDYLARAEVVFDKKENPVSQIQNGQFVFHTKYADYTPTEYIMNKFTWVAKLLAEALMGGDE